MIKRLSASLVRYLGLRQGAVERPINTKLDEFISVMDFGAKGDGVTDDSAAFQAAVDAAVLKGGKLYIPAPSVDYRKDTPTYIRGPIIIQGWGGSTVSRKRVPYIRCPKGVDGFVLVPSADGFLFSPGITGVQINDLSIRGPDTADLGSTADRGGNAITVDVTVNGGVYHVRECCFQRNHILYMNAGFEMRGVCYLNEWYSNRALWCNYGCVVDKVPNAAEGNSDQSRFFGNEFVLCEQALVLSQLSGGGSQTIIGNTLSEGKVGCIVGYNSQVCFQGNQVESNQWYGFGLTIPAGANPASESAKLISGNCFIFNSTDINIESLTTVLSGGFPFSLRIESNNFQQTKTRVLRVAAVTGAQEFDSNLFYLASDNVFSRVANPSTGVTNYTGTVPPEMIEPLWKGRRGYQEDGAIQQAGRTTKQVTDWMGVITIPYGKQCYIRYRMRGMPADATTGTAAGPASILFNKVGGNQIKNDFGGGGELFLKREDVGSGLEIIWGGNVAAGQVGMFEVTYCIVG